MKVEIKQIAYNDSTSRLCHPDRLIYNKKSDKFLENSVIVKTIDNFTGDYIGVLSARFEQKMRGKLPKKTIAKTIEIIEGDNFNHKVYSFFGGHTKRNIWKVAEHWQPGIIEMAQLIFDKFDPSINILQLNTPIIYQNAFVATSEVYRDYVKSWLGPLMKIMSQKEIKKLLYKDAMYKGKKISPEQCEKVFGRPYYTFHPFVCERFFSTYCAVKGITVKHL